MSTSHGKTCTSVSFKNSDRKNIYPQYNANGQTADQAVEDRIKMSAEKYSKGDDATFNGTTYKVVKFDWEKTPSVMLFTAVEGGVIQIDFFKMAIDDADLATFMNSFEPAKDFKNAFEAAKKVDSSTVKF